MELWDLYDANKILTGKQHTRGEIIPKGFYHLVVHVWIKNKDGKYLIAKRAKNRPTYPLLYECVGGSVLAGESSRQGAIREVKEEIGLDLSEYSGKIIFSRVRDICNGVWFNDIFDAWLFEFNGEVDLSLATTDEVCETMWLSIEEIKTIYDEGKLVPTLDYIFEIHEKLQKDKEKKKKIAKNKKKFQQNREKSKYFDYYDDIKHGSHKIVDW